MDRIQHSADEAEEIDVVPLDENGKEKSDSQNLYYQHVNNRIYDNNIDETAHPHKKYSKEANARVKRATQSRYQEKNTCSLYIQTDPLIWRHIRESIPDVSI